MTVLTSWCYAGRCKLCLFPELPFAVCDCRCHRREVGVGNEGDELPEASPHKRASESQEQT